MLGTGNTKLTQTHNLFSRAQNLFIETNVHPTDHEIPHNEIGLNVKKRKPYG